MILCTTFKVEIIESTGAQFGTDAFVNYLIQMMVIVSFISRQGTAETVEVQMVTFVQRKGSNYVGMKISDFIKYG
jgi:hypothetical protein